jgi:hypothetical protein
MERDVGGLDGAGLVLEDRDQLLAGTTVAIPPNRGIVEN